ncbi:MAG: Ribosomal RNA small subunit methyltransferase B [Chlamydiales bacterium]|nr:Ribosomal RNA small subunit methyltransferase B [Chlamydiales bacterium]MCH9635761.1 Ribosomal RNA small subunit methyltransferase B [Chlamydiales bacterium]MCH9703894.1 RsmB/NOP family class I SAM-dependent RNA methyltransferase [Chlamydiota bacterium]
MALPFPEYHLFQLLRRFDNQHLPLDLFLSHYFRSNKAIGSKDRRFIASAVYDMVKWKSLLDHLAEGHPTWEKRYNLYKNLQPASYLNVNTIPLHVRLSFPKDFVDMLRAEYGEKETIRISQASNCEAPIAVRVNPTKISREELMQRWEAWNPVEGQHHHTIILRKRQPLVATPEFREGMFEIQDEASQMVGDLVDAKPGDHILDFCAGAGGKTLAFAYKTKGRGQIYLHDIRPIILENAKKRLKRAGVQNAQMTIETNRLPKRMDWILVDAPCSGTGTYRRNPDQKWKFKKEMVEELVEKQRAIFATALNFLKPGGKIIYATCSLLKQENEQQMEYFMKKHNLQLVGKPFNSGLAYGGPDALFAATFEQKG